MIECSASLTGTPTSAYIHFGAIGQVGNEVLSLDVAGKKRRCIVHGKIEADEIGNNEFEHIVSVLFLGDTYINIITQTYADGEVH
eukprot:13275084-Ditylum_brightwellii.AAC.1